MSPCEVQTSVPCLVIAYLCAVVYKYDCTLCVYLFYIFSLWLLSPITIFNLKLFSSSCIIAHSHIHYNNDNLLL